MRCLPWTCLAVLLLPACGLGELGLQRTEAPAPVAVKRSQEPEAEPSRALATEGEYRLQEPAARRERRAATAEVEPLVMPLAGRDHPRLYSRARGSISVGTVTAGYLVDGAEIPPEGPHHRILAKVVERQTRFATDEMKSLLLCAAERVAREHPGHKLHLGNLARHGGGPLPWSVSHHNGRDADLGFYARLPNGRVASPEHLYRFNRRLAAVDAPQPMRFDVAANWSLIKGLLTCPGPPIQRLFMANWLKAAVLQHARKQKDDEALIVRAAMMVAQPRRALAHDDHLHLRVGCLPDDTSDGCVDAARAPAEAVGQAEGVAPRLPKLRAALRDAEPQRRAQAATLLGLYRDPASVERLLGLLGDDQAQVRRSVLEALAAWRPAGADEAVQALIGRETDPAVLILALRVRAAADPDALLGLLADPRVLEPPADRPDVPRVVVRGVAAALLAESRSLAVARALPPLLADAEPSVRTAARTTLARIVNRTTDDLLAEAGLPLLAAAPSPLASPAAEAELWRAWLQRLPADADREALALAGLQRHGLSVSDLERERLPAFVRALTLPPPYRDNAERWIARLVQYRPAPGRGARAMPAAFWGQWLVQRKLLAPASVAEAAASAGGSPPTAASDD